MATSLSYDIPTIISTVWQALVCVQCLNALYRYITGRGDVALLMLMILAVVVAITQRKRMNTVGRQRVVGKRRSFPGPFIHI